MADYTIVYGGSQAASKGYASGGVDVMLILGRGEPSGSSYPHDKAAIGSEYVDVSAGFTYQKQTNTGADGDWVRWRENFAKQKAPAAKRKRAKRKSKAVKNA